ncbi:hypothetical protein, partial [Mycobacterium avium]
AGRTSTRRIPATLNGARSRCRRRCSCADHTGSWCRPPLREALKGSYRPGQENDKQPSAEYLAIARAAIDAVAHKESRAAKPKPAAPRPARKPVQLALFELASPES